jgi:hypothetical protein
MPLVIPRRGRLFVCWAAFLVLPAHISAQKGNVALEPWRRFGFQGLIHEPKEIMGKPYHGVTAIAVSPDQSKIAVAAGSHGLPSGGTLVHILILSLNVDSGSHQQIDVISQSVGYVDGLEWVNNGRLLFVHTRTDVWLIEVAAGSVACSIHDAGMGRFAGVDSTSGLVVDGGFVLVHDVYPHGQIVNGHFREAAQKKTLLAVYDLSCQMTGRFEVPGRIRSMGTAPSASLLALSPEDPHVFPGEPPIGISILRGPEWRLTTTVPARTQDLSFLDRGKLLCTAALPNAEEGSLECWRLDGLAATLQSRYQVDNGGTAPLAASAANSLVMFAERTYSYNPFTENKGSRLKRYVLWNARSGQRLASIGPRKQWPFWRFESRRRPTLQDSLVFAVSPNGCLVGLAVQEGIEVFRVPNNQPEAGACAGS